MIYLKVMIDGEPSKYFEALPGVSEEIYNYLSTYIRVDPDDEYDEVMEASDWCQIVFPDDHFEGEEFTIDVIDMPVEPL